MELVRQFTEACDERVGLYQDYVDWINEKIREIEKAKEEMKEKLQNRPRRLNAIKIMCNYDSMLTAKGKMVMLIAMNDQRWWTGIGGFVSRIKIRLSSSLLTLLTLWPKETVPSEHLWGYLEPDARLRKRWIWSRVLLPKALLWQR